MNPLEPSASKIVNSRSLGNYMAEHADFELLQTHLTEPDPTKLRDHLTPNSCAAEDDPERLLSPLTAP